MNIAEIARYAGTSPATVRAAIERRDLEAVTTHPRQPGQWMARQEDVDHWVAKLPKGERSDPT